MTRQFSLYLSRKELRNYSGLEDTEEVEKPLIDGGFENGW